MKKISALLVILGLILGLSSFAPTLSAKTTYKTLAFDKKLEQKGDFANGKFQNMKLQEADGGIEMSSADGGQGEYITPVIEAPFGATHIGIHWKENHADESSITAFLRTSEDGVNFGDWTAATTEKNEGPNDMSSEEAFAALIGTEKTKFAQAMLQIPAEGENKTKITQLTLTFLNSADESAQTTKKLSLASNTLAEGVAVEKTSPGGQKVSVISREEWGADESYRLDRKGKEEWPRSYHGTRKVIVHHTAVASSNGEIDLAANMAEVRSIYYYHAVTKNWGDIGYNALVDAAGNVYEGRYGTHGTSPTRTNPTPEQIMALDVEAGHAFSYNSGSFGISAMGDFSSFPLPAAQKTGLEKAMAFVVDSRGINTLGNSDFLRYDGTWHPNLNNVVAHRDVEATLCPGELFYVNEMKNLMSDVDNLMPSNLSGFDATLSGTDISGTSVGLGTLNFDWDAFPNATQYQYMLERVYGTTGSATDNESWETAWFNPENTVNVKTTTGIAVSMESGDLLANSQYVFYVRALDAAGNPISTTKHVNFKRNSATVTDTIAPTAMVTKPANGATVSGIVAVSASANDNVGVVLFELYIDGKKVASATSGTLNYSWNTKKVATGRHTILAKAKDAAGNVGTSPLVTVYK